MMLVEEWERSEESLVDSEMAVFRVWRRKERMEGLMLMEMESFNASKQEFGYGVVWHRDFMVNKL